MSAPDSPDGSVARVAIRAGPLLAALVIALFVWEFVAARQADLALQSARFLTPAQLAAAQHAAALGLLPALPALRRRRVRRRHRR